MYNPRLRFRSAAFLTRAFDNNRSVIKGISMYAIIKTGGKQYRVENGLKLKIEQLPVDVGSELVIDQVLMIADGDNISMGKPLLSGASVKATVLEQGRHDKIRIFKMRRRKHYQKHQGHRQNYTEIQITSISA
jgi:large subunit ribosomal protein L21